MPNVVFSHLYPPIFLCVKTKPQILFLYSKTRVRENSCSGIFYEVNYLRIISNNFLTIWLKNLESITVLVNFRRSQAQLFFRIAAQKPFTENPCEHVLFLVKLKSYACSFSRKDPIASVFLWIYESFVTPFCITRLGDYIWNFKNVQLTQCQFQEAPNHQHSIWNFLLVFTNNLRNIGEIVRQKAI